MQKQSLPAINATLERYKVPTLPLLDAGAPKVTVNAGDACHPESN